MVDLSGADLTVTLQIIWLANCHDDHDGGIPGCKVAPLAAPWPMYEVQA